MSTYLIRWKNGEKVLMEGEDIANAFNQNGYTKEDIDAIDSYNEIIEGDVEHPEYPMVDFCCHKCKGTMYVRKHTVVKSHVTKFDVYRYVCEECGNRYPEASSELRARVAMNMVCAGENDSPTISDINRKMRFLLEQHGMDDRC